MINYLLLGIVVIALSIGRLFVPTVGHSNIMVFIVFAHIFVGVMLTLLWQMRGRWLAGWVALGIPTIVEAIMFIHG